MTYFVWFALLSKPQPVPGRAGALGLHPSPVERVQLSLVDTKHSICVLYWNRMYRLDLSRPGFISHFYHYNDTFHGYHTTYHFMTTEKRKARL